MSRWAFVFLCTSCATVTNTPDSPPDATETLRCPGGHRPLARCLDEGDVGAFVCLDDSDVGEPSLQITWRTEPNSPRLSASWVGQKLSEVDWARDAGPEHVNSIIKWPHLDRTWTLTLHTRLATTHTPARHAGALRGEPTTDGIRCARVGPHDPLPLRATPARRVAWAPGW